MITINEIAEMANASRSTVSRVLNNSGYVSADTRRRIEQVIQETGYVPSQQAKSLRTKKTKVIGVVVPTIQTETASKIVAGIDEMISERGYQVLLANTNLNSEKEMEYLNLLKIRQVDGIILVATNTDPELVQQIQALKVPIVVIGQEMPGVPHVLNDDYRATRDVISYLMEKGHERVAFIGVDETDKAVGYLRRKGFMDEMEANCLPIEENWIQKAVFDVASGFEATRLIMEQSKVMPTAIFAVTDRLAIGAMSYLKKNGFHIPSDIAIASIGASEISNYVEPSLTTVDYENSKAGKEAAQQLLNAIEFGTINSTKTILPYKLLRRDSV